MFSLGMPWALTSILQGNIKMDEEKIVSSLYISIAIVCLAFTIFGVSRGSFSYKTALGFGVLYLFYVFGEWYLILN